MKTMMIIQGSPRREGNTEYACRHIQQALRDDLQIAIVNLYDLSIHRCIGCRACMIAGNCAIQDDDFPDLWRRVRDADIIVQAAPVYWFGPPGIMKDFIDRTHAGYAVKGHMTGKLGYLVSVATDSGFETSERVMSSWFDVYGGRIVKTVRLYACDKGELAGNRENLRLLDELAAAIRLRSPGD